MTDVNTGRKQQVSKADLQTEARCVTVQLTETSVLHLLRHLFFLLGCRPDESTLMLTGPPTSLSAHLLTLTPPPLQVPAWPSSLTPRL